MCDGQVGHETDHLPTEYIQLLKTQDLAYMHMKRSLDEKVSSCVLQECASRSAPTVPQSCGMRWLTLPG